MIIYTPNSPQGRKIAPDFTTVCKASGIAAVALGTVLSSVSHAKPTINGNLVSWPDNGWYQVQSATTYETICEGGRSCLVSPGKYIVINHTSKERFTDVVVGAVEVSGDIQIQENVISWPDDGWYQVQRASDYTTICEGKRSCSVDPGTYIVINHTTGMRYENVVVGDAEQASDITVSGDTISWPDDGWYQVQRASDYTSVCNGTDSCTVAAGTYVVINHTTGKRYEDILVGENAPVVDNTPLLISEATWENVLAEVVTLINAAPLDDLDDEARTLGAAISVAMQASGMLPINGLTYLGDNQREDGQFFYHFQCDAGGDLHALDTSNGGFAVSPVHLIADDCKVDDTVFDGEYQYTSSGREGSGTTIFNDLSVSLNEATTSLQGIRRITQDRISFAYSREWMETQLDLPVDGGKLTVKDYAMNSSKRTGRSDPANYYVLQSDGSRVVASKQESNASLMGEFVVSAPWTKGSTLDVRVDLRYNGDYVIGGGELEGSGETVAASLSSDNPAATVQLTLNAENDNAMANWNQGSITIEASDGSSLTLTPDTGDFTSYKVQVNSADGPVVGHWTNATRIHCVGPFAGCNP